MEMISEMLLDDFIKSKEKIWSENDQSNKLILSMGMIP